LAISSYNVSFCFVCLIEKEGGAIRGSKYVTGKVILLYRQTTLPIDAQMRIVARATDAYNLTFTQKEWASPGLKLTVIDRTG